MFSIWMLCVMCTVTYLYFSDASPAPIVGYACNDTTHYLDCTTTHRYCYEKGTMYVPCYGICNMDSISTKDVERCEAFCGEYFTKECWAVYATTTTQSPSAIAVSDPVIPATQDDGNQSGSADWGIVVAIIVIVVVFISAVVITVVCVCRQRTAQSASTGNASNIAMGNICSCCYSVEQSAGMGLDHRESEPSTEPLVTSSGTTPPASNSPGNSSAHQLPPADEPAAADQAAEPADEAAAEPAAEDAARLTDTIASHPVSTPIPVSESQVQQPTCP